MKNLIYILAFIVLISCNKTKKVRLSNNQNNIINSDSLDIIAKKFIWYNEFSTPKVYEVEEPELNNFFKENKDLSLKYFPSIVKKYNLTFGRKIIFYCYLYELGDKEYILKLCRESMTNGEKKSFEQALNNHNIINPCL